MTDSYYDDIITIALHVPGVWLSVNQGEYGIRFDASRPLREILDEFAERFQTERPWRILPAETAVREDYAVMTVVNEIDRTCNVYVNNNRHRPPPGEPAAHAAPLANP